MSIQQIQALSQSHRLALQQTSPTCPLELARMASELGQLADRLTEISTSRGEFLSKVSHELRTPLTIAKGWIAMLRGESVLPAQQRVIEVVDQQLDELARLANDLLDLSRREAGTLQLRLEVMELVTLTAEVVALQQELLARNKVDVRADLPADDVHILADRGRIIQVLNNLIANACRHVPQDGSGRVTVVVAPNPTAVCLSVADNGIGIAPEHLEHLFDPFYQVERGKSGKCGLGLTVVKELVQAHGGMITVDSALGHGTRFDVWLPIGRREPAQG